MAAPAERVRSDAALPAWPVDRIRAAGGPFRLVAAVVLVAAAPLVDGSTLHDQVRFGLFIAIGWIPLVGVIAMVGRRRQGRVVDVATVVADLSLLVLLQLALEPRPLVLVVCHLLVVAYATYVGGRRLGARELAGFMIIATTVGRGASGTDGFALVVYPITVLALTWLLDAVAAERSRASAGLLRTRKKSDAILSGVAESVVVTTPMGRIEQWNRAAERTFLRSADAARGHRCADVLRLHVDGRELDCSTGCALLVDAGEGDVEVWRTLETGVRQPLLACALPVVDAQGTVVEIVHSYRDITKLKQVDEAKALFLATASHELKTPLTVISGFSQMLLMADSGMQDEERNTALRAIDRRASQLTGIVDRLLMSSRIEAGRIELAPAAIDVVPILAEQVSALRTATGRAIDLNVEPNLPELWADGDALTTIVDHLLDNAVKYSPNGGLIGVSVLSGDVDVCLSVVDHGIGMTEEQQAGCFERFFQAEPTDARRFGGTGLGLYIVRSLVEAMDGTITVRSLPGRGTTFRVVLPRVDRPVAPVDPVVVEPEPGRGDRSIIREYMRQLGVKVDAR